MAIDEECSGAKLPAIRNRSWDHAPALHMAVTTTVHKNLPNLERILISSHE